MEKAVKRALVSVVVAATLSLQFLVPTFRLLEGERPARFGWQMYAAGGPVIEFVVHHPGGTENLGVQDVGGDRIEIDYEALTPPQLCARFAATAVEVWVGGELTRTESCL